MEIIANRLGIGNKGRIVNDQSKIKGTITGTGYYIITPTLVQ